VPGVPGVPGEGGLWLLLLLGLVAWQGWMTLTLFGPGLPWRRLLDDEPILSGRHPLHLYPGALGARSYLRHGTLSCYDPAFQAGYPKTPVFDSGSRPAELFLACAGGTFRPAAYKVGLALCCLLAPLALAVSAGGAGLGRRGSVLTVLLGLLVWWGRPCRRLLEQGDLDLLLAALAAVAQAGLLIRLDRQPSAAAWLGTVLAGFLGCLSHPLLFLLLVPLFLIYYLSVGARHQAAWSLLLFAGAAVAVAGNAFWLIDWVRYWWVRVPPTASELRLPHNTLPALWHADLWGEPLDRGLILLLFAAALAGALLFNCSGRRAAARLFGLGTLALVGLAVGGVLTESLGRLGAPQLLVPGLFFAAPLAAHAFEQAWRSAVRRTGKARRAFLLPVAAGAALVLASHLSPESVARRTTRAEPFLLGLGTERKKIIEALREHTTGDARILWEDRPRTQTQTHTQTLTQTQAEAVRWTALLPVLTGRYFVGGLAADADVEFTADGLVGASLAGRPLREWADDELENYCRTYNIGWVACWSAAAVDRFDRWPPARRLLSLEEAGQQGVLFTLDRPRSFVLKGKAQSVRAEVNRITLTDVRPENGVVHLSLRYQEGLSVSPSRVKIKRAGDERDPLPLIRLLVDSPVARVTITWDR
jgi:hypothetical protein